MAERNKMITFAASFPKQTKKVNMKSRLYVLTVAAILSLCGLPPVQAETLRGVVRDAISGEPLVGATVRVVETQEGGVADLDGNYRIELRQGGRYTIEASYVGYDPGIHKEVLVAGVKEVVLDIELREAGRELGEVVVKPRVNKESTVNPTVLTGGVMLSMEEATRFAGGANDPARLVMAFAGVSGEADGSGLSVHGNAPERMQYRIEGVEVFTPNHYNDLWNAGFGLVSGLNANVIGNSDFFTSTFNANYTNALSGVFDVKMRPGNNARHENILQVGTAFEELTLEGPLGRNSAASYIVNYRYGFTALVDKLKLVDTGGVHLGFQDFSWKLNLPTRHAGTFSLFGLGMVDATHDERLDIDEVSSAYDASNRDAKMQQLLAGVSHRMLLPSKWTWRTTAAYNLQHIKADLRHFGLQRSPDGVISTPLAWEEPERQYLFSRQKQNEDRLLLSTELSKQVTPHWLTQVGAEYSHRFFNLGYRSVDQVYDDPSTMQTYTDMKGDTGLAHAYWQNLLTLSERLSLSAGIAASYFGLSKDFCAEPRVSMKWQPDGRNSLSLGYGLHSMVEKLDAYFYRDDAGRLMNDGLGLSKAHHLLASYMHKISDNLNVRLNLYYQYGFDTPVGTAGSNYCVTNRYFAYTDEPLVAKGNTRNYGGDITLEHYMHRGFFGQANLSLYKSQYRGEDRVWRNQLYDRGFMFKVLGGKEWMLGKNVLNVSAKYSIQGGLRYTPIDVERMQAHLAAGIIDDEPLYRQGEEFTKRFDPTGIVDLTVSYKINKRRVSHTIAFEGLNVFNAKAQTMQCFDFNTLQVSIYEGSISLPNVFYRLDF